MIATLMLLLGAIPAALRSRRDLAVENVLLRHQLSVLTRSTRKRPKIRICDKLLWLLCRRICPDWRRL